MHRTLRVPAYTISALKGINGQKVLDTERVTETVIRFKCNAQGFYHAHISGKNQEDVSRAVEILKICIMHYDSSLSDTSIEKCGVSKIDRISVDLETFWFEVSKLAT